MTEFIVNTRVYKLHTRNASLQTEIAEFEASRSSRTWRTACAEKTFVIIDNNTKRNELLL